MMPPEVVVAVAWACSALGIGIAAAVLAHALRDRE